MTSPDLTRAHAVRPLRARFGRALSWRAVALIAVLNFVWALGPALVGVGAPPVVAQEDLSEEFRRMIADATKLAYEGRYDEAILKYIEAKTLIDDPMLDYNIARCYHKKGDCKAATRFYQVVIDNPSTGDEERREARTYLEELGDCAVTPPVDDKVVEDQGQPDEQIEEPASQQAEGGSSLGTVGLVTMISGGVIVASALALDVASAGLADDFEAAAERGDEAEFNRLSEDIDSRKTAVFALYGVGAAAAVTGVVLWVLADDDEEAPAVGAAPLITPHGGGVVFEGRF